MKKRNIAIIIGALILVLTLFLNFNFNLKDYPYYFLRCREAFADVTKDTHIIDNLNSYVEKMNQRSDMWKYYWDVVPKKNAEHYLFTRTPDGKEQANHPDMLYFPDGHLGYKYWMACTPYPYSNGKYEEPNLLVSNDGLHFSDPKHELEPLVPPPSDVKEGGHLSDTDIYFENGMFVMHYVYNKRGVRGPSKFYRITSYDGIHWSTPELSFLATQTVEGYSPGYVKDDGVTEMWYVGGEGNLDFTQSTDNEHTWTPVIRCNVNMEPWLPWHVDVIKTDKGYEGLLCARNRLMDTRALFYIFSTDGINFKCSVNPIIFPSKNGWDDDQIYRSTFIKDNGKYRIWYSAMDKAQEWHIGYNEFTSKEIDDLRMN